MTLEEAFSAIRSHWRAVIVVTIVGVLATWGLGVGAPERDDPRATHTLVLSPSAAADSPVPDAASRQNLGEMAALVRAPEVISRVARHLEFSGQTDALAQTVRAVANPSRGTIDVTATWKLGGQPIGGIAVRGVRDDDVGPEGAIATAFARQLMGYVEERQRALLTQELGAVRSRLDSIQASLRQLEGRPSPTAAAQSEEVRRSQRDALLRLHGELVERLTLLERQPLPTAGLVTLRQPGPRPAEASVLAANRHLVVAAGLFGFLAALGVLAFEARRPRIRGAMMAARAFRIPVFAEVPLLEDEERETVVPLDSVAADAYRELRTALRVTMSGLPPPRRDGDGDGGAKRGLVVVVTSALGGEGTTSTVANLAAVLAEGGQSVLAVDCDFDRSRLHEYLGAGEGPGLTTVLGAGKRKAPQLAEIAADTSARGVRLLRAGPDSTDHRDGTRLASLVGEARELASVVLVDVPPLIGSYEAFELAAHADAVLVVCRDGDTDLAAADRVAERLALLQPGVCGAVLVCGPPAWRGGSAFFDSDGPLAQIRAAADAWASRDEDEESTTKVGAKPAASAQRVDSIRAAVTRWAPSAVVTVLVWLVLRSFAVQSYAIPSTSMEPTLEPGDRILVNRLAGRVQDVVRGDVVVFLRPPTLDSEVDDLVKRVIAVGGDTVEARGGRVLLNGQALPEPYVPQGVVTADFPTRQVPVGQLWVMGDNRDDSADSRVFGPIPERSVVGRVFAQVWPPLSFETL